MINMYSTFHLGVFMEKSYYDFRRKPFYIWASFSQRCFIKNDRHVDCSPGCLAACPTACLVNHVCMKKLRVNRPSPQAALQRSLARRCRTRRWGKRLSRIVQPRSWLELWGPALELCNNQVLNFLNKGAIFQAWLCSVHLYYCALCNRISELLLLNNQA